MRKVCLVTVNAKKANYGPTSDVFSAIAPNVPLGMMDAYLTAFDIPVVMIDSDAERLTIPELIARIEAEDPIMVGVLACGANPSASTMSMVGVLQFFESLGKMRGRSFSTFVWGGHPTVLPERTLRETGADFVVMGEGYESVHGLYGHFSKGDSVTSIAGLAYNDDGRFVSQAAPALIALDTFPALNWSKIDPRKYRAHNWHSFGDIENRSPYAIIWTNQGCPYPCEFCCINNVFGARRYRFRPMKDVVDEIGVLVERHGVKNLKILDELFIIKHPRIEEFCDLLGERNYDLNMWCFARTDSVSPKLLERLKKVGVNWVAYGIETFDEATLKTLNKRVKSNVHDTIKMTRDAGMYICADVIAGLWEDDRDAILKTRDFLLKYEFEWLNIYPTFAYPGTPLYDKAVAGGIIEPPTNWDIYGLYSANCVPMPTKHMSSADVLRTRDTIFSDYYKDPGILNMLERKFGTPTRRHVEDMVRIPLQRRILEADADPNSYYPAGGLIGGGRAPKTAPGALHASLIPSVV